MTVEIYDQTTIFPATTRNTSANRRPGGRENARRGRPRTNRGFASRRGPRRAELCDEITQAGETPSGLAARVGHARAASLRGLLDEVLEEERKTGS